MKKNGSNYGKQICDIFGRPKDIDPLLGLWLIFEKPKLKNGMKMKRFKVKLEVVDPTGVAIKTKNLTMFINGEESMVKDRLYITVGNYKYRIDNNGLIID